MSSVENLNKVFVKNKHSQIPHSNTVYSTLGGSDLAHFAIIKIGNIAADQIYLYEFNLKKEATLWCTVHVLEKSPIQIPTKGLGSKTLVSNVQHCFCF